MIDGLDVVELLGALAVYCGPRLVARAFTIWVIAVVATIVVRDACRRPGRTAG